MKEYKLEAVVHVYELAELSEEDKQLVEAAKQATKGSYAPYSKFRVGAAARLQNGVVVLVQPLVLRVEASLLVPIRRTQPILQAFVPSEQPSLLQEPSIPTNPLWHWQ